MVMTLRSAMLPESPSRRRFLESAAALPLAAVAHQMFLATSGRGDGAADDSQVIRSYHALNGPATH